MESIETVSTRHPLPAAVIIGRHGFKPPTTVIEDDRMRDFDPQNDALDFYEQFEGMRVQINKPVVVGPTSRFGEFVVLADNGKDASVRSKRGGIILRKNDPNPERIFVSTSIAAETPSVNVGDRFDGAIVGVLDYTFGNFKLMASGQFPVIKPANLKPEKTNLEGGKDRLTVATYNVENLDFLDPDTRFQNVARSIVENLASPDIIGLQEIQDNDGAKNDGIVDAAKTFTRLIDAIQKADGPVYDFCQTNPVNNTDGGQPGGNIRVGFLFNPKRVHFEKRNENADSTQVQFHDDGPFLTVNPGRVAFHRQAFKHSRKPLIAEFTFNGQKVFVINNHLNSKGGDNSLFGSVQPPIRKSEVKRTAQAQIVHDFVRDLLIKAPEAKVIVLGDMNEHEFRKPMKILGGSLMDDLTGYIKPEERYTFIYNGNSQVLDHIFANTYFIKMASPEIDIVHINSEYNNAERASDHDPQVARFRISAHR